MRKHDQSGGVALILSDVFLVIILVAALAFGYWAYSGRQDYKNNVDTKIAAAVTVANKNQFDKDNTDFIEKEKSPYKTFRGPATYGSISFKYPKTWSGYIDESSTTDPIKSLFYPNLVPADTPIKNVTPQYALRVDLLDQAYDQILDEYKNSSQEGTLKAVAYVPPRMVKVSGVQTGTKLVGAIEQGIKGSVVLIKVRDKTLKIYTESPKFFKDFNNIVLSTLTFTP